jgi:hypothetical protein
LSKKKGLAKPVTDGLVIDSSDSIAWCFADEQDDFSQSILDALATKRVLVPHLWHLEVANTLLVGERRKRSTQANTVTWLGFLASVQHQVPGRDRARAGAWSGDDSRQRQPPGTSVRRLTRGLGQQEFTTLGSEAAKLCRSRTTYLRRQALSR